MLRSDESSSRPSLPVLVTLAVIVLLSATLSLALNFGTPYRSAGVLRSQRGPDGGPAPVEDVGAPDERQHVNYVARLSQGKGVPVFDPKDPNLYESYQSHQPPLFYYTASAWAKVVGVTASDITKRSVKGTSTTAGVELRLINTVLGALGVVGVFFLGWWGFQRTSIALGAASVAAFLPMNVALNAAVSNDPLLIALLTWTLALVGRSLIDGWTVRRTILIGVLTGAAILTNTTGVALLPILGAAALLPVDGKRQLKLPCLALAIGVLIALPWWIRNANLYGDPLALKAFGEAFVGSAQAKTFIEGFGLPGYLISWVGWWTARSFVGAFGYMDIWLNETGSPTASTPNAIYRLVLAGFVCLLVGYVASFRTEEPAGRRQLRWLLLGFGGVVALLFLRFNLQYFQAQARYLLPALGPIAIAFALGVEALIKDERWRPRAWIALAATLVGLSTYAVVRVPTEFEKRAISVENGAKPEDGWPNS